MSKVDFWGSQENLSIEAGLRVEWEEAMGSDYAAGRYFLTPTEGQDDTYPCKYCRCRHRLIFQSETDVIALCDCSDHGCDPFHLNAQDLIPLELNTWRVAKGIRRAFGFEEASAGDLLTVRSRLVGTWGAMRWPVFFNLPISEEELVEEVKLLKQAIHTPYMLMVPTGLFCTPVIQGALREHGCGLLVLAGSVALQANGEMLVTRSLNCVFEDFERRALAVGGADKVIARIDRNVETVMNTVCRTGTGNEVVTVSCVPTTAPRYVLKKGHRRWNLVFDGREGVLQDTKGVALIAHLLRHPPSEPIHAVNLEAKVWAFGEEATVVRTESSGEGLPLEARAQLQEAAGARLNSGSNTILKAKVRELRAIMEDEMLPQSERDAAETELEQIKASLCGKAGRSTTDNASKAVERVRKAITRLHDELATAKDDDYQPNKVLRALAEHIEKYILIPSARFSRGIGSRNRAGVAGKFTYEPPSGVVWER